ncbi:MAG TPA: hypothetical protein VM864_09415 [Pyrinomonadaceae bacterium]|jgi:hypothetical protein|nr:hypothetical protein [Pyrinomonadaceae bacterium]
MELTDIQRATEDEMSALRERTLLLKPTEISSYVIYSILKDTIGTQPGGIFTDEEKSQWGYAVKVQGAYLEVYDWKLESWSVGIYQDDGDVPKAQQIGEDFLALIKKQAPKYSGKLKSAASNATGFIYQNPFAIYFSGARNLLEQAEALESANTLELWKRGDPYRTDWDESNQPDFLIDPYQSALSEDLYRSAFFLFVASFEGLLNLLYELYLKPELRDDRIYNRLAREQVDIKLRLAPTYCVCFKDEVIDHRSEEFQRFQYIVDIRNDFIHANLTKPMTTALANEDGCIFSIASSSEGKYGLPRNITDLNVAHLNFVQKTIEDMVSIVTERMKPRYKREFRAIVSEDRLIVDLVESEYVIRIP